MIIRKSRIINADKYIGWTVSENIYVYVENNEDNRNVLYTRGACCDKSMSEGTVFVPAAIGPVTTYNMSGKINVRKDLKKEIRLIEHDFHTVDWHGGDHYGTCIQARLCYPKEIIPPPCAEIVIDRDRIRSEKINKNDLDYAKHVINMFLEIFGFCIISDEKFETATVKNIRKVPWNILPPGKYPWDRVKRDIKEYFERIPNSRKKTVEGRHRIISHYQPDFVAVGQNSFNGYVVYGFEERNLFFFESNETNNATYVFKGNWEEASKLTKRDIIIGKLCYKRLVHVEEWKNKIEQIFR